MALEVLEEEIGTKKHEAFKKSNGIWECNIRDHSLFYLWKKMQDPVLGSNRSNFNMPETSHERSNENPNVNRPTEVVNGQEVSCKNTENIKDLFPEEDKGQVVIGQEINSKSIENKPDLSVHTVSPKSWSVT
ncbi:hypothetical protein PR048_001231 [Dryococelus australis]|uniref:Uncharacterized protein n=1 Tax=Dryococelus australis TaxID=614101 RepID=A0ABQ9IGW8_9NEOP|nr:hypothetical protein PR048_001231 [Dryococelus australis]